MSNPFLFHGETALLDRLSKGLKKRSQEVVFLVGAPLSAPLSSGMPGVPGVDGVIDLIRREFEDDPAELSSLNSAIGSELERRYQSAFQFLQGHRGQQTANEIVRKAVVAARIPGSGYLGAAFGAYTDDECRQLEEDTLGWALSPGTEHLVKLATGYPDRFGKSILTTNFDPLIEVAIRRAGGSYFRTTLHSDGDIAHTQGDGCHVIHLHGYWYGSDTLHTSRQLSQPRPRLRASLGSLLRHKLVVVCAYGGWDDAFTEALMGVVRDDTAYPEIIWTLRPEQPLLDPVLSRRLEPGVDRGRVNLYAGIDCNEFFKKLYAVWQNLEPHKFIPVRVQSNPVQVSDSLRKELEGRTNRPAVIEGDDEDRPPVVEILVGREPELQSLNDSSATVVFLTGLGGQGKSTLAARYFADCQRNRKFSLFVWRDCKEESERFENQLAAVVEKLSEGKVSGEDLAKQSSDSIVDILVNLIKGRDVLFVFDNVDHYVDLESERMTGCPGILIETLLRSESLSARVLFTCRPSVEYDHPLALSYRLEGLSLEATLGLFGERGASSQISDIEDAHRLTDGHAFWLDLLAIQVAKPVSATDLAQLVAEIRAGGGPLPAKTLNSIWTTLSDREQIVLRAMAEILKPETELEISEYLRHEFSYSKVVKALRALRALNLVVVKRRLQATDVLELHPLVRQFILRKFTKPERVSYINAIIKVYQRYIGNHKSQLLDRPSFSTLQYWTQNAELDIAARKFNDAFLILAEVAQAFLASAYSREFSRAVRLLLSEVDWVIEHSRYKGFEPVFSANIRNLSRLGENAEVNSLLDKYEKTVPHKDARFINYCDMRCSTKWEEGDFSDAIRWGRIGVQLKESSDVDTRYDVRHSLALAERDAGQPEVALPIFLDGRSLAEVTDPGDLDEDQGGPHYGNIGRCMHFMGQIDAALICYQKSGLLIEKDPESEHVLNQGFLRAWVGELLVAREQFKLAAIFFRAAYLKWEQIAPPRASKVMSLSSQIKSRMGSFSLPDDPNVEKVCLDWILGRTVDSTFR